MDRSFLWFDQKIRADRYPVAAEPAAEFEIDHNPKMHLFRAGSLAPESRRGEYRM